MWRSPCKLIGYLPSVPGMHRPAVQAHAAAEVHVAATNCVLPAVAALQTAASGTGMPGELVVVAAALRGIVAPLLAVQPASHAPQPPLRAASARQPCSCCQRRPLERCHVGAARWPRPPCGLPHP